MSMKLSPSQIYAIANNGTCEGEMECHWCGSPCKRNFFHDDVLPFTIGGKREYAKKPMSPYICTGCFLFRRKRITVWFPDKEFKDSQAPARHSLLYGKYECLALRKGSGKFIYPKLLSPSLFFVLALIDENQDNPIQHHVSNCFEVISSSMELEFTYNSKPFSYTINDLENALKHGMNGAPPGAAHLVRYFGEWEFPKEEKEDPPKEIKRGRPFKEDERPSRVADRIVRMAKR